MSKKYQYIPGPRYKPDPLAASVTVGDIRLCWANSHSDKIYSIYVKDEYVGNVSYFLRGGKQIWFVFAKDFPGNSNNKWQEFPSGQKEAIVELVKWYRSKQEKTVSHGKAE